MNYDCMTEEELALWQMSPYTRASSPCIDCPSWFEAQARKAGRCNGLSLEVRAQMRAEAARRRQRRRQRVTFVGRGKPYDSEEERLAARRQSWRDCKRRARASQ